MKTDTVSSLHFIKSTGILPVICIHNNAELETLLNALEHTPIHCVEITLRHTYALQAISEIKRINPSMVVGAGTVISDSLLKEAILAGADFCVSPGTDFSLLQAAKQHNVLFIPGCSTPSEIQNAENAGCSLVKFFPADCFGGPKALKLYEGAFSNITFIPTGGITSDNLSAYLACPNVLACGGSFMLPKDKLATGDYAAIRKLILHFCSIRGGGTVL